MNLSGIPTTTQRKFRLIWTKHPGKTHSHEFPGQVVGLISGNFAHFADISESLESALVEALRLGSIPTPALVDELLSRPDGRSELARRQAAQRRSFKPKVMHACPWCSQEFGFRDLRSHRPNCPQNPRLQKPA